MTRASSKIETPAASASVANVWRSWYGPRCLNPAASSAGYQWRSSPRVSAVPQHDARMVPASQRLCDAIVEGRVVHGNDPA